MRIQKVKRGVPLIMVAIICITLILLIGTLLVPALMSGKYGFTSKMAAGSFAEYPCIELEDYDIYWYTITTPEEMECIDGFKPVKKAFIGYTVREEDYIYQDVYCNNEKVAILYSIKGKEYEVQYNSFFTTEQAVEEFYIGENHFTVKD